MGKVLWVISVLGLLVVVADGRAPSQTPAPAVDCTSQIMKLMDCLSFVENGSNATKPEPSCCFALATVLKETPLCLCDMLKPNNTIGIPLNITRASQLPSACGLHLPFPLTTCNVSSPSQSPSPVPVKPSPKSPPSQLPPAPGLAHSPPSPSAATPTSTTSPANAPGVFLTSLVVSLISLLVATFSVI